MALLPSAHAPGTVRGTAHATRLPPEAGRASPPDPEAEEVNGEARRPPRQTAGGASRPGPAGSPCFIAVPPAPRAGTLPIPNRRQVYPNAAVPSTPAVPPGPRLAGQAAISARSANVRRIVRTKPATGRNRVWLECTASGDKTHAPTAVFRPSFPRKREERSFSKLVPGLTRVISNLYDLCNNWAGTRTAEQAAKSRQPARVRGVGGSRRRTRPIEQVAHHRRRSTYRTARLRTWLNRDPG